LQEKNGKKSKNILWRGANGDLLVRPRAGPRPLAVLTVICQ
jgi:hypothetical protein